MRIRIQLQLPIINRQIADNRVSFLALLDEDDKKAVEHGFSLAIESKDVVKVPYKLDGKEFVAKIIAQKTEDKKGMFSVKVQQIK